MEGYNAKKDTSLKFTLKLSPHDPNCPLTGRSKLSRAVYTSVLRLRFRMSLGQFRSVFYVCSIKWSVLWQKKCAYNPAAPVWIRSTAFELFQFIQFCCYWMVKRTKINAKEAWIGKLLTRFWISIGWIFFPDQKKILWPMAAALWPGNHRDKRLSLVTCCSC